MSALYNYGFSYYELIRSVIHGRPFYFYDIAKSLYV